MSKTITTKSGAPAGYHRIVQVIVQNDGENSKAFVGVQSYFDKDARDANKPAVENTQIQVTVDMAVNISGKSAVGDMYTRLSTEENDANGNANPFKDATQD